MAEGSLAARREARRRRILQNSEERLKRITGDRTAEKDGLCTDHGVQNGPVNKTSLCTEELPSNGLPTFGFSSIIEGRQYGPSDDVPVTDAQDTDRICNLISSAADKIVLQESYDSQPMTLLQSIQESRFHFVGLAVLVRLLFYIDCGFIFGESIFIPLLIFEVTDLLLMKTGTTRTPSSRAAGLLGTVLILSGVAPNKATVVSTCLSTLSKIGNDICVYLVSFVAVHCLMGWPE